MMKRKQNINVIMEIKEINASTVHNPSPPVSLAQ